MASSKTGASLLAQRYAGALIEAAEEAKKLPQVEKDIADLRAMLKDSDDLSAVIRSPVINKEKMLAALMAIADKAKFNEITKNFLGTLVHNRRLPALQAVVEAFAGMLSARRGEIAVDVTVAQDLSAKQKKELEAALSKAIGKDVAVNAKVEPSILGGLIVTIGSQMIDDSVARKLARLKSAMGLQANENANSNMENSNTSEVM